ncbi:uncharacterized protein LOC129776208 isoform X3 [Toxorhynchites rutilus septentrionalis]|uniref:uncharacterized protein LOC129776208 isoform X3 n=1 Tax=Toxorhynchites rutilus septentrionalis TaxID=329112 RepID=UPI002479A4BE|nr:uncharacterized protein LOC129776208 isoform X3 [Toxorhynchites rutilus septentrionalis]
MKSLPCGRVTAWHSQTAAAASIPSARSFEIVIASAADIPADDRTKSPGSPGSNGSGLSPTSGLSICPLRGSGGGGGEESCSKAYPSISAAYWLPAPSPTPYQVPGCCFN